MNVAKTQFRRMLQYADPSFRLALRKCADLMETHHLNPQQIVALGADERERLLVEKQTKNAAGLGRRIPTALTHLAGKFPNAGLPVTELPMTNRFALPCRRDEPRQFRADMIVAWYAQKARRTCGSSDRRELTTDKSHLRSCREFLAASRRAGTEVDDSTGIEVLTYSIIVVNTLEQIDRDYLSRKTAMKIFNSLIAVARDVLPPDHPHHRELEEHRSANGMQPSRELSSDAEIRLAKLLTTGAVQVLLKLPDQIEATASEPNCSRKDRVARLAHAFVLGLKLDHPGLTEKQSARMNLTSDITINQGKRYLHLSPVVRGGQCTVEPMTNESIQRLEKLLLIKQQTSLSSPLLFPSREENFGDGSSCRKLRGTANVMQCLYADIRAASGLKLTFTDIKDLVVRILLESGIEPFVVVRRAGYKHVRSVEQRMAAFFRAVGPS